MNIDTPLAKQAHALCLAIEELPASEQQTKISLMASELGDAISRHEHAEKVNMKDKHVTHAEKSSLPSQGFVSIKAKQCDHDLENPVRKGRAHYICQKCGADLTLALVMLHEMEDHIMKDDLLEAVEKYPEVFAAPKPSSEDQTTITNDLNQLKAMRQTMQDHLPEIPGEDIVKLCRLIGDYRNLKEAVKALSEAALPILAWEDRLRKDQEEKLMKSFEEACKNWDSLLSEPLCLTPLRETIAATAHLVKNG